MGQFERETNRDQCYRVERTTVDLYCQYQYILESVQQVGMRTPRAPRVPNCIVAASRTTGSVPVIQEKMAHFVPGAATTSGRLTEGVEADDGDLHHHSRNAEELEA